MCKFLNHTYTINHPLFQFPTVGRFPWFYLRNPARRFYRPSVIIWWLGHISPAEPIYPSPEKQYGIIRARKKQFNTRIFKLYEDVIPVDVRSLGETIQAYQDVISSTGRSMEEMVQVYENVFFSASRSLDEFLKSFEKLILHGSLKPKKALEIIKGSGKFKVLSSQDIFNEKEIDKTMTYEKFLERRKNSYVPIEDFIIKERYDSIWNI